MWGLEPQKEAVIEALVSAVEAEVTKPRGQVILQGLVAFDLQSPRKGDLIRDSRI